MPWDWYEGGLPANVVMDDTCHVETAFSFSLCRSERPVAVELGRGVSTYGGTMFDVGSGGRVRVGQYTMFNGAWIICDEEVRIGDYCLISWNVVIMDCRRLPDDVEGRRRELREVARRTPRRPVACVAGRPVEIGDNVWIGFDACVLPGVRIGEGAVVGARSVVFEDVPPYTVVAGNPARVIREVPRERRTHG